MTESFREVMFWPALVMFAWALGTMLLGLATLAKGGIKNVYVGLVFVVGLGFMLLDGVVANQTRVILAAPALAFLMVWNIQQRRGRWPPKRSAETNR
jgi:hypothetical protein